MALTRKYLGALGIEPEKIDEIINAHVETVNGLKGKIDELETSVNGYKKEAEANKDVQKELDELKKKVEAEAKEREGKDYDKLLEDFENYKAEQEQKEKEGKMKEALTKLLSDMNMSKKGIEMVLKWQGVNSVELDEDGNLSNAKDLRKSIKDDWGEYITHEEKKGADVDKPPETTSGKYSGMSKNDIMAIKDRNERQKAISENMELFGQ